MRGSGRVGSGGLVEVPRRDRLLQLVLLLEVQGVGGICRGAWALLLLFETAHRGRGKSPLLV